MSDEFESDGFDEELEDEEEEEAPEQEAEELENDGFREDLNSDTPGHEELNQILNANTAPPKLQKIGKMIVDHAFSVVIIAIVGFIVIMGLRLFAKMTADGVDVGGVNRIEDMFEK